MTSTRANTELKFDLGQPLNEFLKSDLPTPKDVLRRYSYEVKIKGSTKKLSINTVSSEVFGIWINEGIPARQIQHVKKQIEKIVDEYRNIARNSSRQTESQKKREQLFTEKISKLFDIAHQDAIKILKSKRGNEENIAFLEDQRGPREMMMGGLDEKNKQKNIRSMKRKTREDTMRVKEQSKENKGNGENMISDEDSTTSEESEEEFTCAKKVKKDDVIMVPIHKKKWIENVAKLADKTVTSSRVAFDSTVSSAACMPDVSGQKKMLQDDIVASTSTRHRCREELRKTSAKNIKDKLSSSITESKLPCILVHWDEKQMTGERQVDKSKNYIAVCITATNGNIPGSDLKEKILDIVPMDKSDSATSFETLVRVLNEASPDLVKNILGGVFDTTNTNSGWKKGIMVRLERHCGVKLLHLYCRHHIYERLVNDVCKVVLGDSESPETDVHKRLRDNWLSLNLDNQEPFLLLHRSIQADAEEFIIFASSKLRSNQLDGDYNEVVKLALLLLAAYPSDMKAPTIHSIGAISHARWMAKVICELHIALFSSQLVKLEVINET